MTVLNLDGTPVNFNKNQDPTRRVKWDRLDVYGREVTGSLRTIAHLDRTDRLCMKRFGVHVSVIQPPFNTSVKASAGTHDFDCCLDVFIAGVDWWVQQRFFRACGWGAYLRTPAQGFGYHVHMFSLPEREGKSISDDWKVAGFKVGKYVDGGYSIYGHQLTSSQIEDYYNHAFGLSNMHEPNSDKSWFPRDIEATIFDFDKYVKNRRRKAA